MGTVWRQDGKKQENKEGKKEARWCMGRCLSGIDAAAEMQFSTQLAVLFCPIVKLNHIVHIN